MQISTAALATLAALSFAGAAQAQSRDQISIAGSSTVFPFSTAVAEQFGKTGKFKTPKVESIGTGGGIKEFCKGVGIQFTDIANASRRIKKEEVADCNKNGVTDIVEVKIGFDGIVVAQSKSGPAMELSKEILWKALAKQVPVNGKMAENPYKTWNEVDPSLPKTKIEVLGPPPTSGTRDAYVELVMEEGCKGFAEVKAITDAKAHKIACTQMREDGAFIEAGENDNLMVQKLNANKDAVAIFGFSFLDQNADRIRGINVGGIAPTFENIASGKYSVSRSMFFYVKKAHVAVVPGLKEFITAFTDEKAWGKNGYLLDKGLIPLPDAERKKVGDEARALTGLNLGS
ncbi:MAG: putative phosphate-binding protein pstS [Alphaproteobacteria bacterium]|jgi:phosphate transport system substrate-binding protein|nr:putative phosphate-binding protein pstS [Alphaproteobacteria bacterium]